MEGMCYTAVEKLFIMNEGMALYITKNGGKISEVLASTEPLSNKLVSVMSNTQV